MKFNTLLSLVNQEPIFTTGLLLSGKVSPARIRLQLDRWAKKGRIIRLRRGLYTLAAPYTKTAIHPFHLANRLGGASYVSLHSALAYYGLIPEYVPVTTAVTTGRPREYHTPLGTYLFRHIKSTLFNGYTAVDVAPDQPAFIATPEKALFDLLYLTPHSDCRAFIRELRLQNTGQLDLDTLKTVCETAGSSKLQRAFAELRAVIDEEEYDTL